MTARVSPDVWYYTRFRILELGRRDDGSSLAVLPKKELQQMKEPRERREAGRTEPAAPDFADAAAAVADVAAALADLQARDPFAERPSTRRALAVFVAGAQDTVAVADEAERAHLVEQEKLLRAQVDACRRRIVEHNKNIRLMRARADLRFQSSRWPPSVRVAVRVDTLLLLGHHDHASLLSALPTEIFAHVKSFLYGDDFIPLKGTVSGTIWLLLAASPEGR